MLDLAEDDLRRAVSRNAFEGGRAYEAGGRVTALRVQPGPRATVVEANVQGSVRRPYHVRAEILKRRSGVEIDGVCSCPVGWNCKHVAAALLAAMRREGGALAPVGTVRAPAANAATPEPDARAAAPEPTMPGDIAAWLHAVERAREDETEDYPPSVRKRLLYVVRPVAADGLDRLGVDLVAIELRRDGSLADRVTHYSPYQFSYGQPPRFLRPSDRAILRGIAGLAGAGPGNSAAAVLRQIIATGRGRWGRVDGPELREGEKRPGRLTWRLGANGTQRLALDVPNLGVEADSAAPVLAGDPWYAEPGTGVMGPLELALPPALLRAVLAAPAVPPEAAELVGAEIARRLPGTALPAPRPVAPARPVGGQLTPCLHLYGATLGWHGRGAVFRPGEDSSLTPLARLNFLYEGVPVPALPHASSSTVLRDGQLYTVSRDRTAEDAAWATLAALGLRRLRVPGPHEDSLVLDDAAEAWLDIVLDDVPALRRAGWQVEVDDSFPVRLVEPEGDLDAELREGTGEDWFELHLGTVVGGERVDLVPLLLALIASGDAEQALRGEPGDEPELPLLLPLPGGRLLALPMARVRPILATLVELYAGGGFDSEGGTVRLLPRDAALLAALDAEAEAAGLHLRGGEALRHLGRALRDGQGIPHAEVPAAFQAQLRPYQQRGVDWLQLLRGAGLGAVLADDMGLGKTVQALAHLSVEHAAGRLDRPALVVCPTSIVPTWRAEAARFAPDLRTLALHGPARRERFGDIAAHDLVITTYPLLFRDAETLTRQEWSTVLLDEAHSIKNPAARTTLLARKLRGPSRIALTGTPIENNLGELWSLFDWVLPGYLGNRKGFARAWRTPIERGGDTARRAMLARRVQPFLLRRTKAEVASELPPRTEILEPIELGENQRAIYDGIRLAMHAKIRQAIAERGLARSGIVVLEALLRLRQACCDPRLLKLAAAKSAKAGSAKLDRLMELLPELVAEGRRVLVFSQFTSMLTLIGHSLDEAGLAFLQLTGRTRDRESVVRRFQAGQVPLFLVSLKAGGVGLTLTAADTVVHYDPWWNPAVEDQATDRAHRIGQDKPVFVHRLVALGTVEERMETLKARKQALASGILGGAGAGALGMTEADIETLFAPAQPGAGETAS